MIEIEVLGVREAANLLHVSRDSIYDAIRRNQIRVVRIGKRLHVVKADVLAYRPRPYRNRRAVAPFWQSQTTEQLLTAQRVLPFAPNRFDTVEEEGMWDGFDSWLEQEKQADMQRDNEKRGR